MEIIGKRYFFTCNFMLAFLPLFISFSHIFLFYTVWYPLVFSFFAGLTIKSTVPYSPQKIENFVLDMLIQKYFLLGI